jgi:hypothetical protein
MNLKFITILLFGFCGIFFACKKVSSPVTKPKPTLPQIVTKNFTNSPNGYYWTVSADVVDSGNTSIIEKGVCYSKQPNPTINDLKVASSNPSKSFGVNLSYSVYKNEQSPLGIHKKYYCRPYATNVVGTSYGDEISFYTDYNIEIGSVYKGGVIVYLLKSGDKGYDANLIHGLIAIPQNQISQTIRKWGCDGTDIVNAKEVKFIGSGKSNTSEIIKNCNDINCGAKYCDSFVFNGFDDWFLPSIEELFTLALNNSKLKYDLLSPQTNHIWSSSQIDSKRAYALYLTDRTPTYSKNTSFAIIPFRVF